MDQREIVKQRLTYHFKNTDGSWNSPEGMPFMKEFLDEVEKLANSSDSIDHVSDSFIETMKMQKQHHDEMEVNEARVGNYDTALAHRHRSGAIGDLMIRALNDR